MPKVAIGMLGFLAVGCASTAMFDLAPRDGDGRWLAGQQWVERAPGGAEIAVSFERIWLDRLLLDVSVTNRSDSTIRIDPRDFSYTLTSQGDELPAKLRRPFAAIDPERELAGLDQQMAQAASSHEVTQLMNVVTVVVDLVDDLAVAGRRTREEQGQHEREERERQAQSHREQHDFATSMASLSQVRDRLASSALRRTDLLPGQSICGKLSLPAGPAHRAVGHLAVDDTSRSARLARGYTLTLHVPFDSGAQDIVYALRRR